MCLYSATDGVEDVTFEVLVPTTSYCTCFVCLVLAANHLLCSSCVLCALQRGQANTARLAVAHPARKLLLADFDVASGATAVRSEKKRTWGMLGGCSIMQTPHTHTLTMAWPLPESWMGKMFERTYESYRVLATAADGTKIPITIAHRTDVSHDRRYACHTTRVVHNQRVSHSANGGIVGCVCMVLFPRLVQEPLLAIGVWLLWPASGDCLLACIAALACTWLGAGLCPRSVRRAATTLHWVFLPRYVLGHDSPPSTHNTTPKQGRQ